MFNAFPSALLNCVFKESFPDKRNPEAKKPDRSINRCLHQLIESARGYKRRTGNGGVGSVP